MDPLTQGVKTSFSLYPSCDKGEVVSSFRSFATRSTDVSFNIFLNLCFKFFEFICLPVMHKYLTFRTMILLQLVRIYLDI